MGNCNCCKIKFHRFFAPFISTKVIVFVQAPVKYSDVWNFRRVAPIQLQTKNQMKWIEKIENYVVLPINGFMPTKLRSSKSRVSGKQIGLIRSDGKRTKHQNWHLVFAPIEKSFSKLPLNSTCFLRYTIAMSSIPAFLMYRSCFTAWTISISLCFPSAVVLTSYSPNRTKFLHVVV